MNPRKKQSSREVSQVMGRETGKTAYAGKHLQNKWVSLK